MVRVQSTLITLASVVALLCIIGSAIAAEGHSTLYGKHIAGYQGWFSCPDDGGKLGWRHWFRNNQPNADHLAVDMWPDLSEFKQDELCATGLQAASGSSVYLFSSRNPQVVRRHFEWMRKYHLDGVALQRFVSELGGGPDSFVNVVLNNVINAAAAEDRDFFIMYDLSGNDPQVVEKVINDWKHLSNDLRIQDNANYIHHISRPVVGLWGAGLGGRGISVDQISELIQFFHTPPYEATIIGGVPMSWRTQGKDSRKEPGWANVFRSYDVISPWSVGRIHDLKELNAYLSDELVADMKEAGHYRRDYMPVLYPGVSFHNGQRGKVPLNHISRGCGNFYIRYGEGLIESGVKMMYTAMFDEVNEGTAIFKVDVSRAYVPENWAIATLSDNSCVAESDMYLRIAGHLTHALRSRVFH